MHGPNKAELWAGCSPRGAELGVSSLRGSLLFGVLLPHTKVQEVEPRSYHSDPSPTLGSLSAAWGRGPILPILVLMPGFSFVELKNELCKHPR